jgi:hypothetical protein
LVDVANPFSPLRFHVLWTTDHPSHPQLELLLQSILVVHHAARVHVRVDLWLYQPKADAPSWAEWVRQHPLLDSLLGRKNVLARDANLLDLATRTPLEEWVKTLTAGSGFISDHTHWIDSDLLRLLVLYQYGGIYVDADTLVLRSFAALSLHEFVYQWGTMCHKPNGAVMRFAPGSKALDLMFRHVLKVWPTPSVHRPGGLSLGTELYESVFFSPEYRSRHLGVEDMNQVAPLFVPSCFVNPNWHGTDVKYQQGRFASQWNGPFAFHLHGSVWKTAIDPESDYASIRLVIQNAFAFMLANEAN